MTGRKIKKLILMAAFGIILCMTLQVTCLARAGGGGSGSGGGSGGSGGSHSSSRSYGRSRRSSPIGALINNGIIVFMVCGGSIAFAWKVRKAGWASKKQIRAFEKTDGNWNYKEMQGYVRQAYFEIQECWRRQDVDYAKDYLSRELRENWRTKLAWMEMRDEEEVQEDVRLLSARPVKAKNPEGTEGDHVWYVIHGKMKDYRIRKSTGEFLEGNEKAVAFYEYWKFVYEDERWKLDEIKQKNEINLEHLQ